MIELGTENQVQANKQNCLIEFCETGVTTMEPEIFHALELQLSPRHCESQYLDLQEWENRDGIQLIGAKEASVDMTNGLKQTLGLTLDPSARVLVASDAQCNYESMSRGDAACTSTHIVEIWFHIQVVSDIHGTSFHSIVSKWTPLQGPNLFQMTNVPELVPTGSLQRALPFCVNSGVATVIP